MRVINRPGSQLLGANGRDDGAVVSFLTFGYCIILYPMILPKCWEHVLVLSVLAFVSSVRAVLALNTSQSYVPCTKTSSSCVWIHFLLLFCQITPYTRDGVNKISLTGCDARLFCMGIRIARRRTVQQVGSSLS